MTPVLRFQNALRILWNLDRHVLVEAGVIDADDDQGWFAFRQTPHRQAIRLDDTRMERLYALIESKQPNPSTVNATYPPDYPGGFDGPTGAD